MKRYLPWIGWLFSLAAVSILLMSARWKLTFDPWYVKEWGRIGWDPSLLPRIGMVQLACVVLYLVPPTSVQRHSGSRGAPPSHPTSASITIAVK